MADDRRRGQDALRHTTRRALARARTPDRLRTDAGGATAVSGGRGGAPGAGARAGARPHPSSALGVPAAAHAARRARAAAVVAVPEAPRGRKVTTAGGSETSDIGPEIGLSLIRPVM